jgi:hypothetical protein
MSAALCWYSCATPDCANACTPSTDAGAALYNASGASLYQCGAACGLGGEDWSCVGRVAWPSPNPNEAVLTVQTLDVITYAPVAGVDVVACYADDPDCGAPYAQGKTDIDGSAPLAIPKSPGGHDLGAGNYLRITSPGTMPLLYFWGFPVSQPAYNWPLAIGPGTEWQQAGPGGPQDAGSLHGTVMFNVSDCSPGGNHLGVGVRVSIDVSDQFTSEFYYQGTPPMQTFTAIETDTSKPALPGNFVRIAGGFVGVPAGIATLTATPHGAAKPSGRATVYVREGTITQVNLMPTP